MVADGRITIRRTHAFSVVPDAVLEHPQLSFGARVTLAWMLGRPDGWDVRIGYMRRALGLTDKTWPRVRNELAAAGFFMQRRETSGSGTFQWINEVCDAPLFTIPPKGGDGAIPPVGRDGDGRDARGGDKQHRDSKQKEVQQHKQQADSGRTPQQPQGLGRKARRMRPSGIVTWYDHDSAAAEEIEQKYSEHEIQTAISRLATQGKEPVPGRVSSVIDDGRRAHEASDRRKATEAILQTQRQRELKQPLDPESLKKGLRYWSSATLAARDRRKQDRQRDSDTPAD